MQPRNSPCMVIVTNEAAASRRCVERESLSNGGNLSPRTPHSSASRARRNNACCSSGESWSCIMSVCSHAPQSSVFGCVLGGGQFPIHPVVIHQRFAFPLAARCHHLRHEQGILTGRHGMHH